MVAMLSSRPDTIISALPSGRDCKIHRSSSETNSHTNKISKGRRDRKAYNSYCCVDDVHVGKNPKNARDSKAEVDHEGNAVDDWVVLLDEHEKDIGSEQMAELAGDAGKMSVGGPYGLGKQLRECIEEFYYDRSVVSMGKPLGKMEIEAMIQAAIEPQHISSAQHAGFLLDV